MLFGNLTNTLPIVINNKEWVTKENIMNNNKICTTYILPSIHDLQGSINEHLKL